MIRDFSLRPASLTLISGFIVLLFARQSSNAQIQVPPPTSVDGQVATYGDRDLVGFHYPPGAEPDQGCAAYRARAGRHHAFRGGIRARLSV